MTIKVVRTSVSLTGREKTGPKPNRLLVIYKQCARKVWTKIS